MALQVWLPLNGTLENKGLSNVTVTSQGTVAYDNNGKIGKCFISGGTSLNTNGISLNSNFLSMFNTTKGCSVAAWIKPVGTHVHYNGTIISSGNWNGSCWAFGVSLDNTRVDVFSSGYNRWINCNIPVNQWTHLACTFLNGTSKVYKNGKYVGELGGFDNFISDASNTCIGRETYANGYFGFNGRINDVRIYNHALSAKEVKEISKGLILHYKLDGNDIGITIPRNGGLIPDGVELYDYIEGNGTSTYLDTGINPRVKPRVVADLTFVNAADKDYWGNSAIAGSAYYADFNQYLLMYYRFGTTTSINCGNAVSANTRHIYDVSDNVYLDGTLIKTTTNTYTYNSSQSTILIFKAARSNYYSDYKLHDFKLYDGDTLVRHLLPCTYLGEPGMWDTVENKFYRNQGTGLFTLGSKITLKEYEYLQGNGSSTYIDTNYYPNVNTKLILKRSNPDTGAVNDGEIDGTSGQVGAFYISGGLYAFDLYQSINSIKNTSPYIAVLDKGTLTVDNNIIHLYSSYRDNWVSPRKFYLLGCNRGDGTINYNANKIYYCLLYENNLLVRDFVPVSYNGTPGLWDKVEWKFYANAGSGSFTLGPEIAVQQDVPVLYDSSGYCNHGNITGTLTTNSDSSRYTASTVFSSYTNYITAESVPNKQNCSISFWFNPNSISNNLIITGHDSTHYIGAMNGSNIYNNGSGQSSKLYVDGVEASFSISGTNIYFNKSLQSGWHHYCFTNVDLSSWNTFRLGGYGSGWPINGKLVDMRVYTTTLSADDVKELYDTSAFVTDNGVFAEYELYEDNLSDVKKRGLLETANFYENGADENYALDTDKTRVASNYIISEDFIEI